LRQRILSVPNSLGKKGGQSHQIIRKEMLSLLEQIRNLPQKITDPNWMDELEEKDGGLMR
jgi:hypothetical protein